ncbi:PRC-barrel domain-containing protein [Laspinema olomoucense]|uniref:PRC-barrel domain-containing protein n=1 Tax=Laspinema olomoucense TaxID=3231600 RepID=UPI0021BB730F|nr:MULTISPECIES: PRC-barrel domain-containing protein [unclassified Laspinema]MCT7974488.1 PRC-barrel domain-containing protein [Laspinema sp. D3d]MCT7989612.1 PRC-barrel domain-containing protein [Laspinema sp. D3a]MCT7997234.1 PRC-barrel domain-containing protein [Laspinema sp. D3c]
MAIEQQVIQYSQLINRRIIDRSSAEEVGRLDELWLNAKSHHVVGFSSKSGGVLGLGVKKHSFTWEQIYSIGADSILVNINAEAEEPEKSSEISSPIMGHEVLTDSGNTAGELRDYIIATQTGAVVGYLYKSSGWRGAVEGTYLLSPDDISSIGSKRILVIDTAIQDPQPYTDGMNQKLNKVGELLKDDYTKTMGDLRGLMKGAQNISEQAKIKVQEVAGQAREGTISFAEQAREGTVSFAEQAREKASEVANQTRDRVAEMRGESTATPILVESEVVLEPKVVLESEGVIEYEVISEAPPQPEKSEN